MPKHSLFILAAFLGLTASLSLASPARSEPLTIGHLSWSAPPAVTGEISGLAKTSKKKRSSKMPMRVSSATVAKPRYQAWMSPEIIGAWNAGYRGQRATITVVDDFTSGRRLSGDLGTGSQPLRHGEWTRLKGSMLAPSSMLASHDYSTGRRVTLSRTGLNVANLSYGMFARSGTRASQIAWSAQESSLIGFAKKGSAVIAKAAGNDGVAVGAGTRSGNTDFLNVTLVGTPSTIFVGALDRNGTRKQKARLASYSNFAGKNPAVQRQFLTVGVHGDLSNLYGTSFAAPVVSGYAAVLGSKFTSASPSQISRRLLDTARTDTIQNYKASVHGRGQASISRALAPSRIN
ncbi:S8 family serine peptidase [Paracoccus sp. T5]|uniref:S8 family serine peptidase n=1 Tax=Paracoccus sp. T5 TaxID=3402161 RepID=UPI003AE072CE